MPSRQTLGVWLAAVFALAGGWVGAAPTQQPQTPPQAATGTGLIAGRVVEFPSGRPIADVNVTIVGRGSPVGRGGPSVPSAATDAQGRFSFPNLRADTYIVRTDAAMNGTVYGPASATIRPLELADGARVVDL